MSVNMSAMDDTDYSDFEYQFINIQHDHDATDLTGDNARSVLLFSVDPLAGVGGLDNNEVAELVYLEATVSVGHDLGTSDDQDVGSETELKGSIGANFNSTVDLVPGRSGGSIQTDTAELNGSIDDATNTGGQSITEDRVFEQFRYIKTPAFDDQTNGPGGGGTGASNIHKKPFRQMVGRGPVLDSTDDITVLSSLQQDDEVIGANGNIDIQMVWDIAETSDAGRAFSVPK